MEWDAAISCQLQGLWSNTAVSQSMRHQRQYCMKSILNFPTFGSTTISKTADAASEFCGMSRPIEKKYLTDQVDCSSLKHENDILQLHKRKPWSKVVIWRCKRDSYFVTMYMWRAWNQNLSTHPPQCSAPSRLSHWNWMMAPGLWNGRIMGSMCQSQVPHCKTCELSKNIHRTFL